MGKKKKKTTITVKSSQARQENKPAIEKSGKQAETNDVKKMPS